MLLNQKNTKLFKVRNIKKIFLNIFLLKKIFSYYFEI